jgi:hypothetical protein
VVAVGAVGAAAAAASVGAAVVVVAVAEASDSVAETAADEGLRRVPTIPQATIQNFAK